MLQLFPVFQEMLLLGAGDPVIVADAVRERVEFRRHLLDVLIFPFGDLSEGKHAHAIEYTFHHRSDAMDLLEVVFLSRPMFTRAPSGG